MIWEVGRGGKKVRGVTENNDLVPDMVGKLLENLSGTERMRKQTWESATQARALRRRRASMFLRDKSRQAYQSWTSSVHKDVDH